LCRRYERESAIDRNVDVPAFSPITN
jgi:hypothetical protein